MRNPVGEIMLDFGQTKIVGHHPHKSLLERYKVGRLRQKRAVLQSISLAKSHSEHFVQSPG
jgi:hypothetical protein